MKLLKFPLFFAPLAAVLALMICLTGCTKTAAPKNENANVKTVGYNTGDPQCDKSMIDLDAAMDKVNSNPNSSAELKNKAFQMEIEKRSYLKALEDPNNKPSEKKQITDICKATMEKRISELGL